MERVFNLDSEENGVEAIQCADGRLSIYWNTSKAKDAAKLEKDAATRPAILDYGCLAVGSMWGVVGPCFPQELKDKNTCPVLES